MKQIMGPYLGLDEQQERSSQETGEKLNVLHKARGRRGRWNQALLTNSDRINDHCKKDGCLFLLLWKREGRMGIPRGFLS